MLDCFLAANLSLNHRFKHSNLKIRTKVRDKERKTV